MKIMLVLLCVLTLSGCMWGRMRINDPSVADRALAIKPGVTRGDQVADIIGAQPTMRMPNKDYSLFGIGRVAGGEEERRAVLYPVISLSLLAGGCITKHAGVSNPNLEWKIGETTRKEVVSQWGNPDRMRGDTWVWRDWNLTGGKLKVAYMAIGLTISNKSASTTEHHLTFDPAGRLARHEVVDSVPGGATWSTWPW